MLETPWGPLGLVSAWLRPGLQAGRADTFWVSGAFRRSSSVGPFCTHLCVKQARPGLLPIPAQPEPPRCLAEATKAILISLVSLPLPC